MWTHALARDYTEMDKIMEVLPDEVMHVRHYQGHWYKNNDLLNSMEEKEAPLSKGLLDTVANGIASTEVRKRNISISKKSIYEKAKKAAGASVGLEWITPVERPEKYHKNK